MHERSRRSRARRSGSHTSRSTLGGGQTRHSRAYAQHRNRRCWAAAVGRGGLRRVEPPRSPQSRSGRPTACVPSRPRPARPTPTACPAARRARFPQTNERSLCASWQPPKDLIAVILSKLSKQTASGGLRRRPATRRCYRAGWYRSRPGSARPNGKGRGHCCPALVVEIYLRVAGSPLLIADTPSSPAILQMGCEKSLCRLGTATMPW